MVRFLFRVPSISHLYALDLRVYDCNDIYKMGIGLVELALWRANATIYYNEYDQFRFKWWGFKNRSPYMGRCRRLRTFTMEFLLYGLYMRSLDVNTKTSYSHSKNACAQSYWRRTWRRWNRNDGKGKRLRKLRKVGITWWLWESYRQRRWRNFVKRKNPNYVNTREKETRRRACRGCRWDCSPCLNWNYWICSWRCFPYCLISTSLGIIFSPFRVSKSILQ